jgi:hypothetical protein
MNMDNVWPEGLNSAASMLSRRTGVDTFGCGLCGSDPWDNAIVVFFA